MIWSPDDVFSAGANLEALMPVFMKSGGKGIAARGEEAAGRDAAPALRDACRWSRRCAASRSAAAASSRSIRARRVAAMESYMGLVEVGVGLVPGGGGLTYIARRAAEMATAGNANADILKFLTRRLHQRRDGQGRHQRDRERASSATCSGATSSCRTRTSCCTSPRQQVEGDVRERLARRRRRRRSRSPAATRIATIKAQLVNMRDGGFISAHDFHISTLIADVVCGGDVDAGSLVNEEYLMALERKHFCALLDHPKTQERIMGMLQTGKPVRN